MNPNNSQGQFCNNLLSVVSNDVEIRTMNAMRRYKDGTLVLTPIERYLPNTSNLSPFAKNLALFRLKMGFTQKMLGEFAEVGEKSIGSYEEGRAEPRISGLIKISDALQVDDLRLFLTQYGKK